MLYLVFVRLTGWMALLVLRDEVGCCDGRT
jgi:hypothetical protein